MGLVDRYKEELKSQGIDVNIKGTKLKKDRTNLLLGIIGAAMAIPIYFLIFTNYNECTVYAGKISGVSSATGSFYLKCGVNSMMYSVAAALLIFIVILVILKALRSRSRR
jgi:ABC-type Fe3+ transport system permease subunit